MCGLAGFAGAGSRRDLERMTTALAHRGPDGEGYYVDEPAAVFLGHRRLAIVDIAAGAQPMWNADETVGVIFNGEIYNHLELRAELERRGHRFRSDHSDTEVLVHGYREWGEDLPLKLNGMFAFVVYDKARRRLFAARDRFGEKPFYYSHRPGFFAFASELTALAAHDRVDRSIDTRALQKLFAYGFIPAPNAALKGARKLPGGHWLSFDLVDGDLRLGAYWQFATAPDPSITDKDEPRLVEECAFLLTQASQRRLMSDRPLGVFLSGGLDSSLILAALAGRGGVQHLNSFTIGFNEASFDESAHARTVAEYLGTAHHERILDMDLARALAPSVLGRLDEPLGDASILPTHLLSAFAREKVTVALSGDGGDELFAGYDPFAALLPAHIYSKLVPGPLHRTARRLVDLLPVSHANMSLDFKLRRTLMGLSYPEHVRLPTWMSPLDPQGLAELFEAPVEVEDVYEEAIALWERDPGKSTVDRALEFYTQFYLQDDILAKSDRASMMCSLETRAVFLDNDLVDFCQRLPACFKYRNGQRKYLLKKVARSLLPAEIVDRKKKGFGIPLGAWMRQGELAPTFDPVDGVRTPVARRLYDEHRRGAHDHRLFLWSWLSTQAFAAGLRTPQATAATPRSRKRTAPAA